MEGWRDRQTDRQIDTEMTIDPDICIQRVHRILLAQWSLSWEAFSDWPLPSLFCFALKPLSPSDVILTFENVFVHYLPAWTAM